MDFISDPAIERADTVGQQPGYLFHESDGIVGEEVGRFLVGRGIEEIKTEQS